MKFFRLPNGHIVIPVAVSALGIDAHAYEEIGPDDPRYAEYTPFFGGYWEVALETNDWDSPTARVPRSALRSP